MCLSLQPFAKQFPINCLKWGVYFCGIILDHLNKPDSCPETSVVTVMSIRSWFQVVKPPECEAGHLSAGCTSAGCWGGRLAVLMMGANVISSSQQSVELRFSAVALTSSRWPWLTPAFHGLPLSHRHYPAFSALKGWQPRHLLIFGSKTYVQFLVRVNGKIRIDPIYFLNAHPWSGCAWFNGSHFSFCCILYECCKLMLLKFEYPVLLGNTWDYISKLGWAQCLMLTYKEKAPCVLRYLCIYILRVTCMSSKHQYFEKLEHK